MSTKMKVKYKHWTVCHKREFVSAKGVCKNAVESLWALLKGGTVKRWKGPRGQEEAEKQFLFRCFLFNCRRVELDPWCELLRVMRGNFPVTMQTVAM